MSLDTTATRSPARDRFEFPEEMVALTEQVAASLGHGTINMHWVCPTKLIFVPCRAGLSHSELECCTPEHATAGADMLANMVHQRAIL